MDAVPLVTELDLQPLAAEAADRWAATGISSELANRLKNIQVTLSDLPGAKLGLAVNNTIVIDRDAAGHGWFVDPTPRLDDEFVVEEGNHSLHAVDANAVDRIDLLTVVEHELGHVLGMGDFDATLDDLMSGILGDGVRRNA
jgi:hypothetical protein